MLPVREIRVVGRGRLADRHAAAWAALGPGVRVTRGAAAGAPFAASVCGPPDERAAAAAALLRAGAHVLLATPAARTVDEAEALVAAAGAAARLLVPASPLVYAPGVLRLMAYVLSRRLGPVQNVFAWRHGPAAERLRHEPEERAAEWELDALAGLVKLLCLQPEVHADAQRHDPPDAAAGDLRLAATARYDDEILATVRVDPDLTPARRGLLVTCRDGVLRWEAGAADERLTLTRGRTERPLPVGPEEPEAAMVAAFWRAAVTGTPPWQPATALTDTLRLRRAWGV
jgi:predicted dehydrogenase